MDDRTRARARRRSGVILAADLGSHPARTARRDALQAIRPGAWVAGTQPVDLWTALEAVRHTVGDRVWAVTGEAALWLYGVRDRPARAVVGTPLGHALKVAAPLEHRRVAERLLLGRRTRKGMAVVALEVAVVQFAADHGDDTTRTLVEDVVRDRRTTLSRLRARCYRGIKGSARVRRVCDDLAGGSMDADVRRLVTALEARGVTGLEVEVRIEGDDGELAYGDLRHEATNTLIEVDGFLTHAQRDQFRKDRRRDRWMRRVHRTTTLRVDVLEIREDLDAVADDIAGFLLPPADAVSA